MAPQRLAIRAAFGLVQLFAGIALTIFPSAGTLDYWQGWLFIATFIDAAAGVSIYLWFSDRALLERRLGGGASRETQPRQKLIRACLALAFLAELAVPAFDYRWHGATVPPLVAIAGDVLVVAGFIVVMAAFRANTFAASTIQVAVEQSVVTTGAYAVVRHPMYSGALVLLAGMPLALGSWISLVLVIPSAAVIAWRLLDEEAFLAANLPGYADYLRRVRWRLVPRLW